MGRLEFVSNKRKCRRAASRCLQKDLSAHRSYRGVHVRIPSEQEKGRVGSSRNKRQILGLFGPPGVARCRFSKVLVRISRERRASAESDISRRRPKPKRGARRTKHSIRPVEIGLDKTPGNSRSNCELFRPTNELAIGT